MSKKMEKLNWMRPLVAGLFVLAATTRCGGDKTETAGERPVDRKQFLLSASNEMSSRTVLDGLKIKWQSSDVVGVFGGTLANVRFTNTSSTEEATAVFSGTLESTTRTVYAYYPYAEGVEMSGSSLKITLPAKQPFVSNATFGPGLNPTVAAGDITGSLLFRNLCGVIKVRLTGNVTLSSLEFLSSSRATSGAGLVAMGESGARPVLTMTAAAGTGTTLTGINQPLQSGSELTYYLVLPIGEYAGFTLRAKDSEGHVVESVATKTLHVKPAVVTTLSVLDINPQVTLTPSFGNEEFTEESWTWE